jgi:phosphatidate cytidylyltransferase
LWNLAIAAAALAAEPLLKSRKNMLAKRALSAVVMLFLGFALVLAGGWVFTIGAIAILAIASWEYGRMFVLGGYHPSLSILIISNSLLFFTASLLNDSLYLVIFSICVLLAITYQILVFHKYPDTSAVDLAATLSGMVFIGFLGSFLIRLRFLPGGLFWLILAVAPAGLGDIGAYFLGSLLGRHKLAPNLSPKKTIEGYLGGLFISIIAGYAAGAISAQFDPALSGYKGLLLGLAVGLVSPLGDLGKSLIKRQFNLKHTSNLIPGHGGVLDRVDTWLWAGVVGYYLIVFFFLQ